MVGYEIILLHVRLNARFYPSLVTRWHRKALRSHSQRVTKARSANHSMWMGYTTCNQASLFFRSRIADYIVTRLAIQLLIKQQSQTIQRDHTITCDETLKTNPVAFRLHSILPWYTLCIIFHFIDVFLKWQTTDNDHKSKYILDSGEFLRFFKV